MASVSVEVPAELVSPIRETVLLLYQASAESLGLSLRAHSERRGSLEEVRAHRTRLAQLDELASSLGWRGAPGLAPAPAPRPGHAGSARLPSCSTTPSTARRSTRASAWR